MIGMQQLWDEFERTKLARETKRGMREAAEQGYRAGGRAPYGYRRRLQEPARGPPRRPRQAPRDARARARGGARSSPRSSTSSSAAELTPKAIADHLNRPGGPPSPRHVDSAPQPPRALGGESTIRSMLRNPVYTGRTGLEPARLHRGQARRGRGRAPRPRGVGGRGGHAPAARLRGDLRGRAGRASTSRPRGPARAQPARLPVRGYGALLRRPPAALDARQGAQGPPLLLPAPTRAPTATRRGSRPTAARSGSTSARTALLRLVERFFEQRIFGPMRLDKLEQAAARPRPRRAAQRQARRRPVRQQIADLDRRIKAQIDALEKGIEPELVSERIAELRDEKEALEAALPELGAERAGGRGRGAGRAA